MDVYYIIIYFLKVIIVKNNWFIFNIIEYICILMLCLVNVMRRKFDILVCKDILILSNSMCLLRLENMKGNIYFVKFIELLFEWRYEGDMILMNVLYFV